MDSKIEIGPATGKKIPLDEKSIRWNSARKFQESKLKVGRLVVANLAVWPILIGVMLFAIWTDPKDSELDPFSELTNVQQKINPNLLTSALILWVAFHFCEIFLLLAVAMDNYRFCRFHLFTTAPVLEILTILYFVLLMWSIFNPMHNNRLAEFIIVTCSVVTILALFFSVYLKALSEYTRRFTKYVMALKYWPKDCDSI